MIDDLTQRSEEIRSRICGLPGVRNARIQIVSGSISTIRILADDGEQTQDVVKRVSDLLSGEFGASVDSSVIEVVPNEGLPNEPRVGARRNLAALTINRSGDRFTAQAILDRDRRDFVVGEADASATPALERRAVATAVIGALRTSLEQQVALDSVDILQSGGERIVIVRLELGSASLVGSAIVRRDDYDAIARATLTALNRFVAEP